MNVDFKALVYVILLLLFLNNKAAACSCFRGAKLVEKEVKRSTLVLLGKVLSVEEVAFEIKDSATIVKEGKRVYF
jgi:hypothetical protein